MADYPSPCTECHRNINGSCNQYDTCSVWKTRYYYRQKQINAKYRQMQTPKYERTEAFVYEHPDQTRRFLQEGPCVRCPLQETCDWPCPSRLLWWDLCMEVLRKKVGQ